MSLAEAVVIIPVKDGASTLGEQLDALQAQRGSTQFRVVVADNGSTDGTARVVSGRAVEMGNVEWIDASAEPGPNFARNLAAATAREPYLLFCDADDVVGPCWVSSLTGALAHADLVGSRFVVSSLNAAGVVAARSATDLESLHQWREFLPYTITAGLGVRRDAFRSLGGFDPSFGAGGDDVDFCWRAQLAGLQLSFAPEAIVHYRLRPGDWAAAKQRYRYGIGEAHLYHRFARAGMPRRSMPVALRTLARLAAFAPLSVARRRDRATFLGEVGTRVGNLRGSLRFRVVYL